MGVRLRALFSRPWLLSESVMRRHAASRDLLGGTDEARTYCKWERYTKLGQQDWFSCWLLQPTWTLSRINVTELNYIYYIFLDTLKSPQFSKRSVADHTILKPSLNETIKIFGLGINVPTAPSSKRGVRTALVEMGSNCRVETLERSVQKRQWAAGSISKSKSWGHLAVKQPWWLGDPPC